MKLSRCQNVNCQHILLSASTCCHCNKENTKTVGVESLHDRADAAYKDARRAVSSRNYASALVLLDAAKQWSPAESGIYFYRMLARLHCSFEGTLLLHGFDCREEDGDPDFMMARKFAASDEEKRFYELLVEADLEIRKALGELERTAFEKELEQIRGKIRSRGPEISALQEELQKLQQELMEVRYEMTDLTHEVEHAIRQVQNVHRVYAERQFNQVNDVAALAKVDDLTTDAVHTCFVRLAAVSAQVEAADAVLTESASHHPWKETYDALEKRAGELEAQIREKQAEIESKDKDLINMQKTYQDLQDHFAKSEKALHEFRFLDALYHEDENSLMYLVNKKTGILTEYMIRKHA